MVAKLANPIHLRNRPALQARNTIIVRDGRAAHFLLEMSCEREKSWVKTPLGHFADFR